MRKPILEVKNLTVDYRDKKRVQELVKGVDFQVYPGQCLGILGESGSGKSMTMKAVMGLLDSGFHLGGEALWKGKNMLTMSKEELRNIRGSKICMILQNPMTCFDPLYRIGNQMQETYQEHTKLKKDEIYKKCVNVLATMQLHNPEDTLKKYPHQLSGGMLQRIMIGLAMSVEPEILIADEPTTAIDAITQFEIMKEFSRIKNETKTAMIFITHDLGVISKIADEVLVLNQGMAADRGTFREILEQAKDPYTRLLVEKKRAVMTQYRKVLSEGRVSGE